MGTWYNTLTTIVRSLINDLGSVQTFDDDRIETSVCVAALIVGQEYDFSYDYVIDIENTDITPDPVVLADYTAIALISLKAACLLETNKYQGAVGSAVKIQDGDSVVDMTDSVKDYADILKIGPCQSYQKILGEVSRNKSMTLGKAIVSPGAHEDSFMVASRWSARSFFDSILIRGY